MTNDILSQVRAMKESGRLDAYVKNSGKGDLPKLAQFAIWSLTQEPYTHVIVDCKDDYRIMESEEYTESDVFDKVRELNETFENGEYGDELAPYTTKPLFELPPVPAMDDVETRAERAATEIINNRIGCPHDFSDMVRIITAAMRGE